MHQTTQEEMVEMMITEEMMVMVTMGEVENLSRNQNLEMKVMAAVRVENETNQHRSHDKRPSFIPIASVSSIWTVAPTKPTRKGSDT
jgi:hypothetical protein